MLRCVAAWRAVTTADVSTHEAETQVGPIRPGLQTFFTTRGLGPHGLEADQMLAAHCLDPLERPVVFHVRSILKLGSRDGKQAPVSRGKSSVEKPSVRLCSMVEGGAGRG